MSEKGRKKTYLGGMEAVKSYISLEEIKNGKRGEKKRKEQTSLDLVLSNPRFFFHVFEIERCEREDLVLLEKRMNSHRAIRIQSSHLFYIFLERERKKRKKLKRDKDGLVE